MRTVISWNVNGLRAIAKKGFADWVAAAAPDVLCIQETKAHPDQLEDDIVNIPGYTSYFASAEKKGYSGVAVYSRSEPEAVTFLNAEEFDREGRTLIVDYPELSVISAYFPNSRDNGSRLNYKLEYCHAMAEHCNALAASGRNFVLCGDYNIAHKPIDLARPKENENSAGYLPEEREWMDAFTGGGFVDCFRMFNHEPGNYTWWSYVTRARERNVGWRLDYHCVPQYMSGNVVASEILDDVMGSDHCPVSLKVKEVL
jgi:exodeoxyribonuclease-3